MEVARHRRRRLRRSIFNLAGVLINEITEVLEEETSSDKRVWVRDWIKRREEKGASANLLKELALEDPKEFKKCLRMTPGNFETLLSLVTPKIKKMDTFMREALSRRIKLEITLNFLATGNSYSSLQHFFRVSKPAISKFYPEVCDAIYQCLEEYIKMPNRQEDWKSIAKGFEELWNFPYCCGAIDGKHILIIAPPNCGSEYFNYKGSNSIVLMALVDHNYCFTYVCVGSLGSESDGGIFRNCQLGRLLQNGLLPSGYCVIADDAFPLQHYLMKAYNNYRRPLTVPKKVFSYRLSRARRIVENAFGILVSRFRVFDTKIKCGLSSVNKLVLAACALHNFLRKTSSTTYLPLGSVDEEDITTGTVNPGQWRAEITELRNLERFRERRATNLANKIRDNLKDYFSADGVVSWQYRHIY